MKLENLEETQKSRQLFVESLNEDIDSLKATPMYDEAQKKAKRIIKKNSKEINRLYKHSENALLSNDKLSYIYAIRKLRTITKQRCTDELLEHLWYSSRKVVLNMIAELQARQQKQAS